MRSKRPPKRGSFKTSEKTAARREVRKGLAQLAAGQPIDVQPGQVVVPLDTEKARDNAKLPLIPNQQQLADYLLTRGAQKWADSLLRGLDRDDRTAIMAFGQATRMLRIEPQVLVVLLRTKYQIESEDEFVRILEAYREAETMDEEQRLQQALELLFVLMADKPERARYVADRLFPRGFPK